MANDRRRRRRRPRVAGGDYHRASHVSASLARPPFHSCCSVEQTSGRATRVRLALVCRHPERRMVGIRSSGKATRFGWRVSASPARGQSQTAMETSLRLLKGSRMRATLLLLQWPAVDSHTRGVRHCVEPFEPSQLGCTLAPLDVVRPFMASRTRCDVHCDSRVRPRPSVAMHRRVCRSKPAVTSDTASAGVSRLRGHSVASTASGLSSRHISVPICRRRSRS